MEPLRVSVRLQSGYVAADPWSPSLDGILAYWVMREQLGDEAFAISSAGGGEMITPDLPLAREDDGEGNWWWVCSSPLVAQSMRHDTWHHRRFDFALGIDRVNPKTKRVQVQGGPFKAYRNRVTKIIPLDRHIHWHCIGDRDEITRLLRRLTFVGAKGGAGEGVVLGVEVTPDGADELLARNHRPLPVSVAMERGLAGAVAVYGIRPPGRIPAHQTRCVLP